MRADMATSLLPGADAPGNPEPAPALEKPDSGSRGRAPTRHYCAMAPAARPTGPAAASNDGLAITSDDGSSTRADDGFHPRLDDGFQPRLDDGFQPRLDDGLSTASSWRGA